jgi:phosphinothricin acetyltransferase
MIIRDATEADLPAIIEIYNAATATRTSTARFDPVTVEERLPWFRRHSPDEFPLWVAENAGELAGWLSFHEFIPRPAYRGTAEISVYVNEPFRRRGIGRQLVEKAIVEAPRLKIRMLLGYVLGHNEASLRLFERLGFERWGRLPRIARFKHAERDLVIVGRHVGMTNDECRRNDEARISNADGRE